MSFGSMSKNHPHPGQGVNIPRVFSLFTLLHILITRTFIALPLQRRSGKAKFINGNNANDLVERFNRKPEWFIVNFTLEKNVSIYAI